MDGIYKEVYFDEYCKSCKYLSVKEGERPCEECLSEPINAYSHKPIKWKKGA